MAPGLSRAPSPSPWGHWHCPPPPLSPDLKGPKLALLSPGLAMQVLCVSSPSHRGLLHGLAGGSRPLPAVKSTPGLV